MSSLRFGCPRCPAGEGRVDASSDDETRVVCTNCGYEIGRLGELNRAALRAVSARVERDVIEILQARARAATRSALLPGRRLRRIAPLPRRRARSWSPSG